MPEGTEKKVVIAHACSSVALNWEGLVFLYLEGHDFSEYSSYCGACFEGLGEKCLRFLCVGACGLEVSDGVFFCPSFQCFICCLVNDCAGSSMSTLMVENSWSRSVFTSTSWISSLSTNGLSAVKLITWKVSLLLWSL